MSSFQDATLSHMVQKLARQMATEEPSDELHYSRELAQHILDTYNKVGVEQLAVTIELPVMHWLIVTGIFASVHDSTGVVSSILGDISRTLWEYAHPEETEEESPRGPYL